MACPAHDAILPWAVTAAVVAAEGVSQPHPGDRTGDHEAEPIGGRYQPERKRDDADDGELHRVACALKTPAPSIAQTH
jgi:hypothetical protein